MKLSYVMFMEQISNVFRPLSEQSTLVISSMSSKSKAQR